MSTQSNHPFGDPSLAELAATLEAVAERHQRIEPVVRDFNRRMRDVFGSCASSTTGEWVTLDANGTPVLAADLADLFRLSTGLAGLARLVERDEVASQMVSRRQAEHYSAPLPAVGDGAVSPHPVAPSRVNRDQQKGGN
jgi:hypothetical protein